MLLRTLYLPLDPYMRGRMNDEASYALPMALGDMVGGTVSRVESSGHASLNAGALVVGAAGWQDYSLAEAEGLNALYPEDPHPFRALGCSVCRASPPTWGCWTSVSRWREKPS